MTDERDPGRPAGPELGGERRPDSAQRSLDRPPSDRYGPQSAAAVERDGSPASAPARPALGRGLASGLLAAALVGLVIGLIGGLFDITAGLTVVGVLGGVLIGRAVGMGARGAPVGRWFAERPPAAAPNATPVRLLAALLGAASVGMGTVVLWIVSLALVREATGGLGERLGQLPLLDWLLPQLGQLGSSLLFTLVAATVMAWRSSR